MNVVTFGEALFRFVTPKGERLSRTHAMNFYLGGTELNIAANLASLGVEVSWVSALPDGMTGHLMHDIVAELGVKAASSYIIKNGQAGWYLMESGVAPRPDIVFHRYASSMASEKSFSFEWNTILKNVSLFHTSGVTAGLSPILTGEVKKAMQAARVAGAKVSYDFNYRKNIWTIEEFVARQKDLIPHIDILFCAESDLELFFNKKAGDKDYSAIFKSTSLKKIVVTQRSTDDSEYGVDVVTSSSSYTSKRHKIQSLDRIGVGDSMAAGFIKSFLETNNDETAAEWAALCGALKYGIHGDMALLKDDEVKSLLENNSRGIIR